MRYLRETSLVIVLGLLSLSARADFATIAIDGDYSDWAGITVADSDPLDNVGSVDLADIQIANDDDFLYLRMTYHGTAEIPTFISVDVDGNTSTGFDTFTLGLIGSEASWQNDFPFTQSTGVFNDGGGMSGDFFGSGAALLDANDNTGSRELALSLNSTFNVGGGAVFPDDTINLLVWTDAGSADVSAPITYTLSVIPEPGAVALFVTGMMLLGGVRRGRGAGVQA